MTAGVKRKVSVTLDADLVEQVEADGGNLSSRVNVALREHEEHRRHMRGLDLLLDRLAKEDGPLDTAEDEAEIRRYMRLLGGPEDPTG